VRSVGRFFALAAAAIAGRFASADVLAPTPPPPGWTKAKGRPLHDPNLPLRAPCASGYRNPHRCTAAQQKRRSRKRRNQIRHKAHLRRHK
jgi:hypothetical protein